MRGGAAYSNDEEGENRSKIDNVEDLEKEPDSGHELAHHDIDDVPILPLVPVEERRPVRVGPHRNEKQASEVFYSEGRYADNLDGVPCLHRAKVRGTTCGWWR